MTTINVGEATAPDDLGLGNVPVVPVFVDSTGRRSRRTRRVGWVVSAACLAYIGLIAVSMSDTQIGPLISIPPVAQSVVEFPDYDAGPPGALEVPPPVSTPTPARAGTAAAVPRTTTMLAAMGGHSTKKAGSKTAQTPPPTSRTTAKAPTPTPAPRTTRPRVPTSMMALGSTAP